MVVYSRVVHWYGAQKQKFSQKEKRHCYQLGCGHASPKLVVRAHSQTYISQVLSLYFPFPSHFFFDVVLPLGCLIFDYSVFFASSSSICVVLSVCFLSFCFSGYLVLMVLFFHVVDDV